MNEDPIIIGGEFERSLGRRLVQSLPDARTQGRNGLEAGLGGAELRSQPPNRRETNRAESCQGLSQLP